MTAESLDLKASYEAMSTGVVAFSTERDVIRVSGPDSLSYLEGQCSQFLLDLSVGESRETLILSPQGKIDAYANIALDEDGAALVVVERGWGELTFERLRRFKLRVKVELELSTRTAWSLRGPAANAATAAGSGAIALFVNWPGWVGFDVLGDLSSAMSATPIGDAAALSTGRIEAGIPAMGRELNEKTIPQEAGIVERTVSFTKGCFTGQELVARLDARGGHVPRRLRGVVLRSDALEVTSIANGALHVDDRAVGEITSVSYSPRTQSLVGLGYVRREVDPPVEAVVVVDDQHYGARIEELPLVGR